MTSGLKMPAAMCKPYWKYEDAFYLSVQVVAAGKESIVGFQHCDKSESINAKNPNHCKPTGSYWVWKNLDADYLGLASYRKRFAAGHSDKKKAHMATGGQVMDALKTTDVVLSRACNYSIETNHTQNMHARYGKNLEVAHEHLGKRELKMKWKYDGVMNHPYGCRFSMFAIRHNLADAWYERLFSVFSELESRLDISERSSNDVHVFGSISERMLEYWVENNGLACMEMPAVNLESQRWVKKGLVFLGRKVKS